MAKLLPFRRSDTAIEPRQPRLVELGDEVADDVFAALSAETARDILGRLYEEPGTATDVAEAADTSLQNARYHLEKLQAAGLVESVDTWYSSRGTEMTVYAPTSEPLVVAAGPDEQTGVLRSALGRLVGALGVLGIASLAVDRLARFGLDGLLPMGQAGSADSGEPELLAEEATRRAADGGGAGDAAATSTPTPTPVETAATAVGEGTATPAPTSTPTALPEPTPMLTEVPGGASGGGLLDLGAGLPPGGLFFLGGLLVIAAVAAWWYWRRYRPLYVTG